jgi:hypothetical protein
MRLSLPLSRISGASLIKFPFKSSVVDPHLHWNRIHWLRGSGLKLKSGAIHTLHSPGYLPFDVQSSGKNHRYLMSRLSLQVFYLLRHVLSTAPKFMLWWSNLEILFAPLHRSSAFIGGLRCQAIQTKHGPYIAERTQKAVYIVRCLW